MEQAVLTIPDDVAAAIQNGSSTPLSRRVLEYAAIGAYSADILTSRQVQEMLGFTDREELFAFFKENDVRDQSFTLEELESGREAMAHLRKKR